MRGEHPHAATAAAASLDTLSAPWMSPLPYFATLSRGLGDVMGCHAQAPAISVHERHPSHSVSVGPSSPPPPSHGKFSARTAANVFGPTRTLSSWRTVSRYLGPNRANQHTHPPISTPSSLRTAPNKPPEFVFPLLPPPPPPLLLLLVRCSPLLFPPRVAVANEPNASSCPHSSASKTLIWPAVLSSSRSRERENARMRARGGGGEGCAVSADAAGPTNCVCRARRLRALMSRPCRSCEMREPIRIPACGFSTLAPAAGLVWFWCGPPRHGGRPLGVRISRSARRPSRPGCVLEDRTDCADRVPSSLQRWGALWS